MNVVMVIGRLVKDAEIRYMNGSNEPIARFALAVRRNYKGNDGTYETDFINCIAFRKNAETIQKYFRKGSRIYVQGEWRTGKYNDRDGRTVYTNEIQVNKFEFVDPPQNNQAQQRGNGVPQQSQQSIPPRIPDDYQFVNVPEMGDFPFK